MKREAGVSRIYQLSLFSPLPSQKAVLTVTENKRQLIKLICNELVHDKEYLKPLTSQKKLVLTGEEVNPYEVTEFNTIRRTDLATNHEEADVIIAQQAIKLGTEGRGMQVNVISDDTDVFLLLLHYYYNEGLSIPMYMESPIRGRLLIDIKTTVQKHRDIVPDLLAAHALSGCDTTACHFGIGKCKVVKVLEKGHSLSLLGQLRHFELD